MEKLTDKEVQAMLPDIINPAPMNEYYIGCDFCQKENAMHVAIFNKTTDSFEYMTKLFTTKKDDAKMFARAISKYFNGTLIEEI